MKIIPPPLCTFLTCINISSFENLEKKVLDCGAGGEYPPLALFHEQGYETYGIGISDEQIKKAKEFCEKNNIELNIKKGDIRNIPFEDNSYSLIYSFNTIVHLNKRDTGLSVNEIIRVLRKGGLCFVNFLSIDEGGYGKGEQIGKGEFLQEEHGQTVIHSYYEDYEPDEYFTDLNIVYKEKSKAKFQLNG